MVQFIGQPKPSFGELLGNQLGNVLGNLGQRYEQSQTLKQENEAAKLQGLNLEGIKDPLTRRQLLINSLKGQQDEKMLRLKGDIEKETAQATNESKFLTELMKTSEKKREKAAPFEAGLETIKRMREIGQKGNLGRGSSIFGFFGGETAKDRGEYEQLGKSLISLASNIPIRNREEFKVLAENLYDPSIPDDQREGILNAMEQIIQRNILSYGEQEMKMDETSAEAKPSEVKKPLKPLMHFIKKKR